MLCPGEKCPHYGKATKYPRKCYYEPQCWRGRLDRDLFCLALGPLFDRAAEDERIKRLVKEAMDEREAKDDDVPKMR